MEKKVIFFNRLQFKINLGILFILAASFAGLGYFIINSQKQILEEDIKRQGVHQAEIAVKQSVLPIERQSFYLLEELAQKIEYSPQVAFCQITKPDGRPFVKETRQLTNRDMLEPSSGLILNISRDIISQGKKIGEVKIGMFLDQVQKEIKNTTIRLTAAFAAVLGLIIMIMYFFLDGMLVAPVVRLSRLTRTLSKGKFKTTKLGSRRDEIGTLADGFNDMSRNLQSLYENLESKVSERTQELESEVGERKAAQGRLGEALDELEAIFENSLVGIAVFNDKQKLTRFNSRFAEIFGYEQKELQQLEFSSLHNSKKEFEKFLEKNSETLSQQGKTQTECPLLKKDGDLIWCQVSAKAIDLTQQEKGIIWVFDDISERKKAREALRQYAEDLRQAKEAADHATRSKSEFLARMSHEIRTPMNAILGMAEMLQESGLNKEQEEYVHTFSSAGELLLGIINDILDFSKIEAGQIELEKIPFNLVEIVEDVGKIMAYRAHEKNLELICDIDPQLPTQFVGDPTRLRQILINLSGNAIKFTEKGEVSINIRPGTIPGLVYFEVKDTGMGIAEDKQAGIFDSFSQEDTSTTRQFGGTGLGLAICKKLIELMGGDIQLKSRKNEGTCFYFEINLPVHDQQDSSYHFDQNPSILVIEDNPYAARSVETQLRAWKAKPLWASTISQSMDSLMQAINAGQSPAAILLDSDFEQGRGVETAHLLMGQGVPIPPVVMLYTTVDTHNQRAEAKESGLIHGLLKPFRRQELFETLNSLINPASDKQLVQQELLAQEQPQELSRPKSPQQTWKILVVDDVEANRKVVDLFLRDQGHELSYAGNGQEAVEIFTQAHGDFDLVLMDMEMPVMDGHEATRRIRAWEKENNMVATSVLALTAHAFQEHRQKTIEAGCTDFLTKPVKKDKLKKAIEQFAGQIPEVELPLAPAENIAQTETKKEAAINSPIEVDPDLSELRPLFLQTVFEFIEKITNSSQTENFPELQGFGHSLKGLGSTYAVDYVHRTGKFIEESAKAKNSNAIQEAVEFLSQYMKTGEAPHLRLPSEEQSSSLHEKLPELPKPNAQGKYEVQIDPEMQELVPFLLEAVQKDMELMDDALKKKDFAAISRFGHSHKGFGTTYGFEHITSLGQLIQNAADAKNSNQLKELLAQLRQYMQNLNIKYEAGDKHEKSELEKLSDGMYKIRIDSDLYDLIPLFMETMHNNITEMRQALTDSDYSTICRHGHNQKGLGSTYGFDYVGELGANIENAANRKDAEELVSLINELADYLDKVEVLKAA